MLGDANYLEYGSVGAIVIIVTAFLGAMRFLVIKFLHALDSCNKQNEKQGRLNRKAMHKLRGAVRENTVSLELLKERGCKHTGD